ncbi:MAG: efflux RND transporter permease subunit [Planctomycetes bacterium]|nr:efflux RND transporter permease subunit [Planctomycetota bacterium]
MTRRGPIAFFAGHTVAANMLMWIILAGGLLTFGVVEQEVFPDVGGDVISVSVELRGASPEEVEEGICIKVEEVVMGLEGVDKVTSRAVAGMGTVSIEIADDADLDEVLDDVKNAVDGIDTFPEGSEVPVVREFEITHQVLNVAVSGDVGERPLRRAAERVRDDLLDLPGITRVQLSDARPYEISIDVSEETLRRLQLTFDEVVAAIRRSSLDLSGGVVKADGGEIKLRTKAQSYTGDDFAKVVLRAGDDGSRLLLGDVASIVDAFEDTGQSARFDGRPSLVVQVYRVGDQRAIEIADRVKAYVADASAHLPPGVSLEIYQDEVRILESRLDLLVRNGRAGLLLVFLTLALFLRLSLAFWVTVGIPVAFMGTLWMMPALDISVNMISLFGFLVALGIVVDDAIVVGENVYRHHEEGKDGLDAVLDGVGEVWLPVVFAVLTTIAAFTPLIGIPGVIGKFIHQMPAVVVPILCFSMLESLFILPAHLSHLKHRTGPRLMRWWRAPLRAWERVQDAVGRGLDVVVRRSYVPTLDAALRWRYLAASVGFSVLVLTGALFASGKIRFLFFPPVEADNVVAYLTLPQGTPPEHTAREVARIERAALDLAAEMERELGEPVVRHVKASVGDQPFRDAQSRAFGNTASFAGTHLGEVMLELVPAEERSASSRDLVRRWREAVGPVAGAVELSFTSNMVSTGSPVHVRLTGHRVDDLRRGAAALEAALGTVAGVFDVADSFRGGQQELRFDVTPEGEALGVTRADLARQVRQAFYGEEAQRVQRGRDEVRVMVRYPESGRRSLGDVDEMRIRLAGGVEAPLSRVADVEVARGDAVIERADRRRSINVTADVDLSVTEPNAVIEQLRATVLPELERTIPGLGWTLEGEQREQADTVAGLVRGFVIALLVIFALLAIPFRSYIQPVIVMLAIPFGIVGAVLGHIALGMDLTVMSMFGIVALTGVIVNDSLVMVDFVNAARRDGMGVDEAVRKAGPARFRAILLTSLTTFAGLLPLLLERSLQAQFLIPMAVSLGFGVMFGTFVTLLLVPVSYTIVEDLRRLVTPGPGEAPVPGGVDGAP